MASQEGVVTADDVAAAVIDQLGPIDAMKLQKLLYYAQGWHLAITDRPLFLDELEAWRDGPVVKSVFRRHQGRRLVSDWRTGVPGQLDDQTRQLVELVCACYGHMAGDDLSKLTHSEQPWRHARRGLAADAWSREPITHSALKRYFRGRELGGRTSADLSAGGLALGQSGASSDVLAKELDSIRLSFRGKPSSHPDESFGSAGRTRAGVDPGLAARLAKRRALRSAG
jgi:uncharacterized phage-associated protein